MAAQIGEAFVAASLRGEEPVHRGNRSPKWAPQGVYAATGEQQWIAISCRDDAEWAALAGLIGAVDLATLSPAERHEK